MFLSTTVSIFRNIFGLISFSILRVRVVLGLSRDQLLITWVAIELNLIMFVCCGVVAQLERAQAIKYFLVQRVSSAVFLWTILVSGACSWGASLILLRMLVKLGAAPFHNWFITFLERSPWCIFLVLVSVQKLLPFFVLRRQQWPTKLLVLIGIAFAVVGRLRSAKIKTLLGFSSVFGACWALSVLPRFDYIIGLLAGYLLALKVVVDTITGHLSPTIREAGLLVIQEELSFGSILGFLSLAGFPPMVGFFVKIWILEALLIMGSLMEIAFLLIRSIFILYLYIQIRLLSYGGKTFSPSLPTHSAFSRRRLVLVAISLLVIYVFIMGVPHRKFWVFRIY